MCNDTVVYNTYIKKHDCFHTEYITLLTTNILVMSLWPLLYRDTGTGWVYNAGIDRTLNRQLFVLPETQKQEFNDSYMWPGLHCPHAPVNTVASNDDL